MQRSHLPLLCHATLNLLERKLAARCLPIFNFMHVGGCSKRIAPSNVKRHASKRHVNCGLSSFQNRAILWTNQIHTKFVQAHQCLHASTIPAPSTPILSAAQHQLHMVCGPVKPKTVCSGFIDPLFSTTSSKDQICTLCADLPSPCLKHAWRSHHKNLSHGWHASHIWLRKVQGRPPHARKMSRLDWLDHMHHYLKLKHRSRGMPAACL